VPWNFFEDVLPPEVTLMVFSHFSLEDVLYVSLVCKTWNTYFDTKHIWKQIYELHFGELSETTVNLTTKFKWKRLFFNMANAQKWKTQFQRMTTMYHFSTPQATREFKELSEISGRHHVLTCGNLVLNIDLKTASKITARNSSPVTYHYISHFLNDADWKRDQAKIDHKKKDDVDQLPHDLYNYTYYQHASAVDRDGKFLRYSTEYCFIWDPVVHLATDKHHPIQHIQSTGIRYYRFSFNAKYVLAFGSRMFGIVSIGLFDLRKNCGHCNWHTYNAKTRQYCVDSPSCAYNCGFTDLGSNFIDGYASKYNADKLLLVKTDEIAIWINGEIVEAIKLSKEISKVEWFSEHMTTIEGTTRHWIVYTTADSTTFVDLNDLTCKFAIPKIDSITWVPKKNKAILVSGLKATVFDVELRKWQAKIKCNSAIAALCFNSSCHLLFIADQGDIHAYQWETGRLVASVSHECGAQLKVMHFALDQVFCLVRSQYHVSNDYYYKRVMRCDV
jgi:hypothetical protein